MPAKDIEEKRFNIILDSISEGVFTINKNWQITSFNKAAEKITGIKKKDAIGKQCKDILKANICENQCVLEQTFQSQKTITDKTIKIIDSSGIVHPISISTALLKDDSGNIIGGVETFRDLSMIEELRKQLTKSFSLGDIISRSEKMQSIFEIIPQVAGSPGNVLIEGESGTGKELLAKAIHEMSARKDNPFTAINAGALPDNLLESELFGYKAGAFTDAKHDKQGKISAAEGGTLFLDEIGDVSQAFQVKLLRFMQERTFEPLGSTQSIKANVKIITATNKSLYDLVKEGLFREDLYYRINVVRITLPPLRERKEDIPLLVDHFIQKFNTSYNRQIEGISQDAIACLMSYEFPGNIRELENIIERAFILIKSGIIERNNLPDGLCEKFALQGSGVDNYSTLKQIEKAFLINALEKNNWNKTKTAEMLGMHKTTLFRKLKSLNITK